MQRVMLHIDMNSYFASVEQQANPFLRGKPVAVCAYLSPGGCIIASSMEAKKMGIKTGMRVTEAKKIYSKVILIQNEPSKYRSVTEKIFKIFSDYTDDLEPYSIDEAFLNLTGWTSPLFFNSPATREKEGKASDNFQNAYLIALEIRQRITAEVGEWLKCSIGIAPTRWLAKFASDTAEKNSVLILTKENLEKIYMGTPGHVPLLTDAWGIGDKTALRLKKLGIKNLYDLKIYPVANLMQALGKYGYYLWANVNGIEINSHSRQSSEPKSIGHSYCLPRKTTDLNYLRPILMKLCEKTGQRLRKRQREAQNIFAYLSYVRGGGRYKNRKVNGKLFETLSIYNQADEILFSAPLSDAVRMLAVSVTNLFPITDQLSFFTDHVKRKRLSLAVDSINNNFGDFTIISGEMFGSQKSAPDRIGFRKVEL